jgi:hypothetical protein
MKADKADAECGDEIIHQDYFVSCYVDDVAHSSRRLENRLLIFVTMYSVAMFITSANSINYSRKASDFVFFLCGYKYQSF